MLFDAIYTIEQKETRFMHGDDCCITAKSFSITVSSLSGRVKAMTVNDINCTNSYLEKGVNGIFAFCVFPKGSKNPIRFLASRKIANALWQMGIFVRELSTPIDGNGDVTCQ